MKAATLLATLRDRDVQVWADGERLRCSAPLGALSPELREELRQRKHEILEFLRSAGTLARQQRAIVPMQPRGMRPPIFAFGGHNGDVFCFRALAKHLGEDQPFFGLQPPGFEDQQEPLARVEDLAAYFAAEIRTFQPRGPYVIAGYCAGGSIAFELARQLLRDGATVSGLALFGAPYTTSYRRLPRLRKRLTSQVEYLQRHARALASQPFGKRWAYLAERLRARKARQTVERPAALGPLLAQRGRVERAIFAALRRYIPGEFDGCLSLFLPCQQWVDSAEQPLRWRAVAQHSDEVLRAGRLPHRRHAPRFLRSGIRRAFPAKPRQARQRGMAPSPREFSRIRLNAAFGTSWSRFISFPVPWVWIAARPEVSQQPVQFGAELSSGGTARTVLSIYDGCRPDCFRRPLAVVCRGTRNCGHARQSSRVFCRRMSRFGRPGWTCLPRE